MLTTRLFETLIPTTAKNKLNSNEMEAGNRRKLNYIYFLIIIALLKENSKRNTKMKLKEEQDSVRTQYNILTNFLMKNLKHIQVRW